MAEFKKLSEGEQIETASDNATVLIEEGGDIKRVPKKEVGGGAGGYTMTLTYDNFDGNVYCFENYDKMYDVLMAGGSVWIDATAMFAGGGAPSVLATAGVSYSVLDSVRVLVMNWFMSDEGLVCDGILPATILGQGSQMTICFPNGSHNLENGGGGY
jgi:hypothetical protein